MKIDAKGMEFGLLNEEVRSSTGELEIDNVCGQRFIAAGMKSRRITVKGTPGNALGAYLDGGEITVYGNAQDAVGDTMNSGEIVIHGGIGDAAGYAMRGGAIYIRDNAGYRAGIHMKEYKEKRPIMVIGGRTGSFLGEYQAGGLIIVLGLHHDGKPIVGNFPGTGMHGGKLILRGDLKGVTFPRQVKRRAATAEDMEEIRPYVEKYAEYFGLSAGELLAGDYTVVTPDSANPYKQLYVPN